MKPKFFYCICLNRNRIICFALTDSFLFAFHLGSIIFIIPTFSPSLFSICATLFRDKKHKAENLGFSLLSLTLMCPARIGVVPKTLFFILARTHSHRLCLFPPLTPERRQEAKKLTQLHRVVLVFLQSFLWQLLRSQTLSDTRKAVDWCGTRKQFYSHLFH